eukprot:9504066-Pyramimonas_sp.AAC.1
MNIAKKCIQCGPRRCQIDPDSGRLIFRHVKRKDSKIHRHTWQQITEEHNRRSGVQTVEQLPASGSGESAAAAEKITPPPKVDPAAIDTPPKDQGGAKGHQQRGRVKGSPNGKSKAKAKAKAKMKGKKGSAGVVTEASVKKRSREVAALYGQVVLRGNRLLAKINEDEATYKWAKNDMFAGKLEKALRKVDTFVNADADLVAMCVDGEDWGVDMDSDMNRDLSTLNDLHAKLEDVQKHEQRIRDVENQEAASASQ